VQEAGGVAPIEPKSDRSGRLIETGFEPRFATMAFGSLWVSNFVSSSVSRIDPRSGKVVAEIATAFGQIMPEASGKLWVSAVDADALQPIDPSSNTAGTEITTEALPDGLLLHEGACGSRPISARCQRIGPSSVEITARGRSPTKGSINANQLLIEASGAFSFLLLDSVEVLKVEIPADPVPPDPT
jgi:streptogramin lyase